MHEEVLRKFFEGSATAQELSADLAGSMVRAGTDVIRHQVTGMSTSFRVQPQHLVRVCEAVLRNEVAPQYLESIGFCLIASDNFFWQSESSDGELVAEVLHHWSAPDINYPLSLANVAAWRDLLQGTPAVLRDSLGTT